MESVTLLCGWHYLDVYIMGQRPILTPKVLELSHAELRKFQMRFKLPKSMEHLGLPMSDLAMIQR